MPAITGGELTAWRTHPQSVEVYCFILNPTVVASRRINMASITYPVTVLTFDNPDADAGDPTDVLANQTIRVKDGTSGAHKGFVRLKSFPTGSTVKIGVTSQGEVDFNNNDILEFLDERRMWSLQPAAQANGDPLKDGDIEFSAAIAQPPVANGGPNYARKIDPDTDLITVAFDASTSYAVREGATITGYQWDFIDGSVIAGSAATATATVTFPAGYRYVSITVTDSNAQTHTAYVLVVAADDDTAIPIQVSSLAGQLDSGWECGINTLGSDVSGYPPGAAVMVWAEEYYGATQGSLNGFADREHVKFFGWIDTDTTIVRPHFSDWQIRAIGPMGMMSRITSYSFGASSSASPSSWLEIEHMTQWRFIHSLLQWDSTILEICDVERSPVWNSYPYPDLSADPGPFINQLKFTTEAVASKITCDCRGRIYFRRYPHYMGPTERDALTTVVTIEAQDWTGDVSILTRSHKPVGLVKAYGGISSGSEIIVIHSIAPGTTQGQGPGHDTLNRQVCLSQTELNERAGRYITLKNLDQPDLGLNIINQGIAVDPAWMEWVDVDLDANSNTRGIGYTDQRFLVTEVAVEYEHKSFSCEERWRLEKATPDLVVPGATQVLPGDDPPIDDDGTVYIPTDGTYLEQPTQDVSIFPPVVTPDELGETLEIFAWTADFLAGAAGFAPTVWYPMYEADGEILDVMFNHTTKYPKQKDGPLGIYILDYDSVEDETTIKYSPDALSLDGPVYYVRQVLEGRYSLLRRVVGVPNGIFAFGGTEEPGDPPGYFIGPSLGTIDLVGDGTSTPFDIVNWKLIPVGGDSNNCHGVRFVVTTAGPTSSISANSGGATTPHMWSTPGGNLQPPDGDGYIYANATVFAALETGETHITGGLSPNTTTLPRTEATNAAIHIRNDAAGTTTVEFFGIYFGSDSGPGNAVYSSDTFKTISSVLPYGTGTGIVAADTDDFGLGISIAAHGARIYYATEYGGAYSVASGADVSPSYHVAIRIPNKKVTDHEAANNDPTALEFIFATRDKLSDDSTLWWATLNTVTGVITDGGDITPVVSATTYVCIENPNALETYGGNPKRIRLLARDEGNESDDTVLLNTYDLGGDWELQQDPSDYVTLWHTSYNHFYLAGEDGLKWTSDAGDNLSDFDGDYETIVDTFPLRGVFAL